MSAPPPNALQGAIQKLAFHEPLTAEEAEAFGQGTYGALLDDRFRKAIKRAVGNRGKPQAKSARSVDRLPCRT